MGLLFHRFSWQTSKNLVWVFYVASLLTSSCCRAWLQIVVGSNSCCDRAYAECAYAICGSVTMSKCHRWRIEVWVTRVTINVMSWKYQLVRRRKPKIGIQGAPKVGSSKVRLLSIKKLEPERSKQVNPNNRLCSVLHAVCLVPVATLCVMLSLILCCPARALGYIFWLLLQICPQKSFVV